MKQALIVGLGMFGTSLARALTERGVEVLCVDNNPELVQAVSGFAAEAVAFDASDEASLAQVHPERRDLCVCAIGQDSRDASIVATALLRQLGAKLLVARAYDTLHERILRLVGAHEVVNPEQAFGERLAARLAFRGVLDQVPLGRDLFITELAVPPHFVGRNLIELSLPKRYKVSVVAVRREVRGEGSILLPDPTAPFEEGDVLVLAAKRGSVDDMLEKL
jgi:trk system potassium uptake protein TrkA